MGSSHFIVRLTDEQKAQLVLHARGRGVSMSGLIKEWISRPPLEGRVHAACDARIAELEREVRQLREPF